MALDLAVLAVLLVAALLGASSGALRQLVQLAAVIVGWLAARRLGGPVADGLARSISPLLARAAASALLFAGVAALVSLAGALVLRGTGMARAVRSPADRGLGALLGGVKGGLVAWVLLSALAIAGSSAPRGLALSPGYSEFAALAREHNLLERLAPEGLQRLERFRSGEGTAPRSPDAVRRALERRLEERDRELRSLEERTR